MEQIVPGMRLSSIFFSSPNSSAASESVLLCEFVSLAVGMVGAATDKTVSTPRALKGSKRATKNPFKWRTLSKAFHLNNFYLPLKSPLPRIPGRGTPAPFIVLVIDYL